jgi:hypothetical protein
MRRSPRSPGHCSPDVPGAFRGASTAAITPYMFAAGVLSLLLCVQSYALRDILDVALQWDNAALQGVRDAKLGAPVAARALAVVHTCMYDAWAAYDERAVATQLAGALRRPASDRTLSNKDRAVSYAA